jgi:hypothetical protein
MVAASAVAAADSTAVAVVAASTVVVAGTGNFEVLRGKRLAKASRFYCAKPAAISAILAAA